VHDRPDRSDCFAGNVKRHQQTFFRCRTDWQQIGVTPLEMFEQERAILIKHVSAWAEIARGSASDVRIPHAGDSWPIEPLAVSVRPFAIPRKQAKASRVTLGGIQDRFS
jgi:hypothetical protein